MLFGPQKVHIWVRCFAKDEVNHYMVSTRAHLTHFDKYAISNKPIDGFWVIGLTQLFVCPHFDLNCHFCHEICEKKVSIEIDK